MNKDIHIRRICGFQIKCRRDGSTYGVLVNYAVCLHLIDCNNCFFDIHARDKLYYKTLS